MIGRTDDASPTGGWITDPIVVSTGEYIFSSTDMSWPHDGMVIKSGRLYREQTLNQGGATIDFGRYFHSNLRTVVDESANQLTATVNLGVGENLNFIRSTTGDPFVTPVSWERYSLEKTGNTQYKLTDKDGYAYHFQTSADPANLVSTRNRYSKGEDYFYNASSYLTKITVTSGNDVMVDRDSANAITRIRDYAGRTVTYAYDAGSNLTKAQDACGACATIPTAEYAYDSNNRITTVKDAASATVRTIAYDGSGRVTLYYDPNSGTNQFVYGGTNLQIDPAGHTTEFTFDGSGNLVTKNLKMDPTGGTDDITYIYQYDSSKRATHATLPDGTTVKNEYDSKSNLLRRIVTSGGDILTTYAAQYEAIYNQATRSWNAANETTQYAYDASGSLTREIRPGALTRTYAYNTGGLVTSQTDATSKQTSYVYDSSGFLVTQTADVGGLALATIYTVDSLGRRLTTKDPEGNNTIEAFNPAGKVIQHTSPEGIVTNYEYDSNLRQTAKKIMNGGSPEYTWTNSFDTIGNFTREIAPGSLTTTYNYDQGARQTKVTAPGNVVTESIYDLKGRVVTTKRGDNVATTIWETLVYDKMSNVVTRTDAGGHSTIYVYDGFGRLITTINSSGAYTVEGYDNASRKTSRKRYSSAAELLTHTTYSYDSTGRPSSVRQKASPGGADGTSDRLVEKGYDNEDHANLQVVWTGSAASVSTQFSYDGAGRRSKQTDAKGKETTYEYDKNGRMSRVTNPRGHATTYEFDKDGRRSKVTQPDGSYEKFTFNRLNKETLDEKFTSGATKIAKHSYTYDSAGRNLSKYRFLNPSNGLIDEDPGGSLESTLYDSAGRVSRQTNPMGHNTNYGYDTLGNQTTITYADGSYVVYEYNNHSILTKETRYEIVGAGTRSFRTDYQVDELDRRTKTINQGPDGTFGNGDDLTTQYVYDAAGRQVTQTNEAGRHTVYAYNSLGDKTRVTEDSAGVARNTDFQYDRAGRLDRLIAYTDGTSNPQTTLYAYDAVGQQTAITYEETGTVSQAFDDAGNMTTRTDEASIAVDYKYDANNRLTERLKSGATTDIEKYTYDAQGRLITAKKGTSGTDDATSRSIFAYDNLSRVTSESQAILGGTAKSVTYTYDAGGNKVSMLHHGGGVTATYAYDTRERCTLVKHNGTTLADYTWLGNAVSKRETTCDYPGSTKPKFKSDYQRDGILRVSKLTNEHTTLDQAGSTYGDLGTWDYSYDSASNELAGTWSGTSTFLAAGMTHTYDTANRLITTLNTDSNSFASPSVKTSWYTYDDLGNRISHKYRTDSAIGYAHDKANRMTTLANRTQGYDLSGNLTLAYSADRGTSYVYRWDHHNRLTGVYDSTNTTRKAAFTWDALGRRVETINDKLGTTTRYYYDGVNEIVEDNPSAARQRYYVHGVSYFDERLMMYNDGDSRPYYYVLDRMFNVRALIDRAGAIVERIAYDAYGQPLIRESCGRGDMDNSSTMVGADATRFDDADANSIWDPRADLDDDGDVDSTDETLFDAKRSTWDPAGLDFPPGVAQAFSDVDNSYLFQGVPHFALDTNANATSSKLMLNHHRARFADPVIGRWVTRDPLVYDRYELVLRYVESSTKRLPGRKTETQDQVAQFPLIWVYLDNTPTNKHDWNGLLASQCGESGNAGAIRGDSQADCEESQLGALMMGFTACSTCTQTPDGWASTCVKCNSGSCPGANGPGHGHRCGAINTNGPFITCGCICDG